MHRLANSFLGAFLWLLSGYGKKTKVAKLITGPYGLMLIHFHQ